MKIAQVFGRGQKGGLANHIDDKRLVVANFRGDQRGCRLVTVLKGEIKPVVDGDSTRSLFSTASAFLPSELRRTSNSIT